MDLPHDDLIIPPWDIGRRSDKRSRFSVFAAEFVAKLINAIEGEVDGELILHGHGSAGVQREVHFRRIRELERNGPPLDEATVDIAPFDFEKPGSGNRLLKTIDDLDRLVPFDGLRQHQLIGNGRSAEPAAEDQQQRGGRDRRPGFASLRCHPFHLSVH